MCLCVCLCTFGWGRETDKWKDRFFFSMSSHRRFSHILYLVNCNGHLFMSVINGLHSYF